MKENSVGILFDRLRWEEKELAKQLESRGVAVTMIDAKTTVLGVEPTYAAESFPSTILQRCVSLYRGYNISVMLESRGASTINSSKVLHTCGNKMLTSEILSRRGIPTPRTVVAFSAESALDAIERIGYPCVMKPIVGSWGRQVVPIRDREMAETLIEMREQQQGADSMQSIFYVQEMVKRPPRDIRCITAGAEIVACVYRYAPPQSWKTNVAVGGHTERCELTPELEDVLLKTVQAIGTTSVLGIDLMQSPEKGYVVHEVNGTVEFRGAQLANDESIAGKMVDYILRHEQRKDEPLLST